MHQRFDGRLTKILGAALTFATLAVLAACGDSTLRELDVGISRDSTLKLLGAAGDDSMRNVFDYGNYIIAGQHLEIFYYDPKNRKARRDTIDLRKELTPIVVVDNSVTGWGWQHVDSVAGANSIQLPKNPVPQPTK